MPFIDDQELDSLQLQVDNSIKEKEVIEGQYDELLEKHSDHKKKSFITNLIFGVIAGITSAISLFLFFNPVGAPVNQEIAENISNKSDDEDDSSVDSESTENTENTESEQDNENTADSSDSSQKGTIADSVKARISGKTVYSVQIKAFNDDQFPVISSAISAIAEHREGYFKYTIGLYDSLEDAQALRKVLIRLGFRDAFVASYIDGVRQRIHLPE